MSLIAVAAVAFAFGTVASHWVPALYAQEGQVKGPKWQYGLGTRVRGGNEADFNKDTKKIGIEVYKDENNGHLIYISETGSIAVVPAK
ncbi:MAG: hypothetical protein U0746_00640 [Gemmataceae bacterium]